MTALVGVLVMAGLVPATAAAPTHGSACGPVPRGLVLNQWQGQSRPDQIGLWNNPRSWSRHRFPGPGAAGQFVCIRTAARVVVPNNLGLQVRVGAIDIGGNASGPADVVLLPTNGLFIGTPAPHAVSHVRAGSRLRFKGAVLGGPGPLQVEGQLTFATGSCPPDSDPENCEPTASTTDPQTAVVTIPPKAQGDVSLSITEEPTSEPVAGQVGQVTVVSGSRPVVTRSRPILLELRYDASVIGAHTPDTTNVEVAKEEVFREIPACVDGLIPKEQRGLCRPPSRPESDRPGRR
jgi:hypothetical protein